MWQLLLGIIPAIGRVAVSISSRFGIFGSALLLLVEPIAGRLLTMFGMGAVTYTGIDLLVDRFINDFVRSIGQLPALAFELFRYAGGLEAAGIILGAIATRMLVIGASSAVKFQSMGSGN